MRVYFIMMSIRVACVASLAFVRGWWVLIAAFGAVVLPYVAVVFANERDSTATAHPEAPTPLELLGDEPAGGQSRSGEYADSANADSPDEALLVFDAPAERRSGSPHSEPSAEGAEPDEAGAQAPDVGEGQVS